MCEVFMMFVELDRITGECIAKALLKFYKDAGINVTECKVNAMTELPTFSLRKRELHLIFRKNHRRQLLRTVAVTI